MAIEVKVPPLGESIVEATVGRWLKNEGDAVKAGETVVELETDKVNLEVAADQAGVLERILRPQGETVAIGDVLATIAAGEAGATAPEPAPAPTASATPPPTDGRTAEEVRVTPVARRVAEDKGVDLSSVQPTGLSGRATKEDVLRATQPAAPAAAPAPAPAPTPTPARVAPAAAPTPAAQAAAPGTQARPEERVRMTRRRQTIAQRLVEAQQTAAMLTTFNELDMTAVMDIRKKRRESFEKRNGVRLGFMSFFVKATIGALKAFPNLNAEIDGTDIILKRYYDIGVAVGAEGGLVVPVVRDADRLTFAQIEKTIEELAVKARNNTLSIQDLQGGTFTITNGGVFGSLLSTPILNPPQVGILGLHKIEERPIARDGQVVIRPMMYVALTYDHRIVDGREAVQFLVKVKELIEDPETLLLEG
ncbi:MAG: 2-oxoglutarate dehydrogenase complex dihydrolipoyllysine-residue succinyltransferase [Anaerolineae bacterium]|nr:2-oxoglutarate dehydrogenase complex dihydrolipoyllysine-residue succinyltransferase [Anaerolineae bacterium]